MHKVLLTGLLLLSLLSGLLTSCAPQDEEPSILVPSVSPTASPEIQIPSGPASANIFGIPYSSTGSLHPILQTSKLNAMFMPLLYEPLFEIGVNFEAKPLLCSRWTQDGMAYLLEIRPNVRFSDGSLMTAEDVRYSLELARSPESFYAGRFKEVLSISVPTEHIVRIECSEAIGRLELLLDIPIIRPQSDSDRLPLGTGPYLYVESEDEHYLKTYSSWWQNKISPLTRMNLIDSPEADLLINSFETGEISLVFADPTATDPIVFGGNYEVWSYATSQLFYLGLNTQAGPFANVRTRRMMTFAVDRAFLASTEMMRFADPAVLPVHPSSSYYNAKLASENAFSLGELAIRLEGIENLALQFIVPAENAFKLAVANRISEDLRAMGVSVNLRELKWDAYVKALQSRDFDLYLAEVKLTSDFDLRALIGEGGSLNFGGYQSEETQALLQAFRSAKPGGISSVSEALYRKILADAPIVPILFKRGAVYAGRGEITSILPTQNNLFSGLSVYPG